jgi:hypothetical protein
MRVFILKEGKEPGQGVGYLDDGTMVVVDQGKKALGKTIEVAVTSVLQTTAGKMIFCRWPEAGPGEDSGRFRALGRDRQRTDRFQAVNPAPLATPPAEAPRPAAPEPIPGEPAPKAD